MNTKRFSVVVVFLCAGVVGGEEKVTRKREGEGGVSPLLFFIFVPSCFRQ